MARRHARITTISKFFVGSTSLARRAVQEKRPGMRNAVGRSGLREAVSSLLVLSPYGLFAPVG